MLAQARASRLGEKQLAQASLADLTCSHACKAKNPSINSTQIIFTPSKAHQIIKSTQQNQNRHIIYKSIKKSQLPLLGKSQPKDSYTQTVSTTTLEQLTKLEKKWQNKGKQGYQEGPLLEPRQQCQKKWKQETRDNLREEGMSSNQLEHGSTEPQQSFCEEER